MPCYRCGERQTDPDRGASPWKRGVREDCQVLICPVCQTGRDWAAEMDHCAACSGVRLVRRLGETECKDCGHVAQPGEAQPGEAQPGEVPAARVAPETPVVPVVPEAPVVPVAGRETPHGAATGLAEEVARALDRMLAPHRTPR